ncbi:MAG: GlsB/YeaQ/YmgE family stress response membrane protein [Pseudomonadota bacterium]
MYMIAAVILGGATGYVAERLGLARNGYVVSVVLGIGGAVVLWFAQAFFGVGLGLGRALTSIVGAAAVLILAGMRR